jgi:hypothetical protein
MVRLYEGGKDLHPDCRSSSPSFNPSAPDSTERAVAACAASVCPTWFRVALKPPGRHVSKGLGMMIILTADDFEGVPASSETLRTLIPSLAGQEDPFAILTRNAEDMTYMQTLWTPTGYLVEYQEDSLERHFATVREDLSAEDVIAAFRSYAAGESGWRTMFEYHHLELDEAG